MAKKKAKENTEKIDDETTEPGDCIGNFLNGDKSCELCEIADACEALTIKSKEK